MIVKRFEQTTNPGGSLTVEVKSSRSIVGTRKSSKASSWASKRKVGTKEKS
jgi:hypothetical protein